jgi:ferredoxin
VADRHRAVAENVPGDFFVDHTCIDCDTCRQLAPEVFADAGSYSFVHQQPDNPEAGRKALRALLACPTGSIGTLHPDRAREVRADFPMHLEAGVYYCGFNSPKSFGGNSYFVERPEGNWLIDSPKSLPPLVRRSEEMGGVAHIFLTHPDDVAEAEKYAQHFSSRRIIHRKELASQPGADWIIDGFDPVPLATGFLAIPGPGHTRGHMCLLVENRFLFTGDHLWWSRAYKSLNASRDVCCYSWEEQTRSVAALAQYSFDWVAELTARPVETPDGQSRCW